VGVETVVVVLTVLTLVVETVLVEEIVVVDPGVPLNKKVAIAWAGTLADASPSLKVTDSVPRSVPCAETKPWTLEAVKPLVATLIVAALPPLLMTCTETLPSGFLNALNFRFAPLPDVPSRTAPGRTYRDHCANAQSRLEGVTVVPLVRIRAELVVPGSAPIQ